MIDEIEVLMRHWGEQVAQHGSLGGSPMSSPLAGLIEWQGAPPRGEPGSRLPGGGSSMDHRAREVQACIDAIGRQGEQGEHLARLARLRYLGGRSVAEQMTALDMAAGSDRTYRNHVHRLHELLLAELHARHGGTMDALRRLPGRITRQRKQAKRRSEQAAKGVLALYRSSDVAPPPAPVSPRRDKR